MGELQTIQNYFNTQSLNINIWAFFFDILLTIATALTLSKIYIKYGKALSNRKIFANNFVILALTTMMIITVIKSSLALSLGLVGALSIVRFRSAIKEPEELAYIFMTVGLGLGFGANQRYVTLLFFAAIITVIIIKGIFSKAHETQNLYLNVSLHNDEIKINQIVAALKKHCTLVNLKRLDESEKTLDALFLINLENLDKLTKVKESIKGLNKKIKISFLDSN